MNKNQLLALLENYKGFPTRNAGYNYSNLRKSVNKIKMNFRKLTDELGVEVVLAELRRQIYNDSGDSHCETCKQRKPTDYTACRKHLQRCETCGNPFLH